MALGALKLGGAYKNYQKLQASFDILNPAKLPALLQDASPDDIAMLTEYENDQVEMLALQFHGTGCVADLQECIREWSSFRQFLKDNCSQKKHREVVKTLCSDSVLAGIYPNMSAMAKISRVVPIHTADMERTFSQLKLIKTNIRNEKTLDSLMHIANEGPLLMDFTVPETLKQWAKKKNRQL